MLGEIRYGEVREAANDFFVSGLCNYSHHSLGRNPRGGEAGAPIMGSVWTC